MPAPRAGNTSLKSRPISCCPVDVDQSPAISEMSVLVALSTFGVIFLTGGDHDRHVEYLRHLGQRNRLPGDFSGIGAYNQYVYVDRRAELSS
jgi:hypothetical protein